MAIERTQKRELKDLGFPSEATKRPISPGAEKWLGVEIPILDHGFIYLVDYMGNDEAIDEAARKSYGRGTKTVTDSRGLERFLRRHRHTSPFEMVELKFHAKMPIFVARDWVRHRTANINELSGRYSILDEEFYIPEPDVIGAQSLSNKQGRGRVLDSGEADRVRQILVDDAKRNYENYLYLLNDDGQGKPVDSERSMLARELARMDLTLGVYTQWYWKIDLHNLFHFLKLRMDERAQYELRVYAKAMGNIARDTAPVAYEAFEDYELNAVTFSHPELKALAGLLREKKVQITREDVLNIARFVGLSNRRERDEFIEKLSDILPTL